MPSFNEVRASLTAPGGAFEVTTELVGGVEMKVYAQRFGCLRAIAEIAASRGDDDSFIVYGNTRIGFGRFFELANGASAALAARGVSHGDRVAVLSANNPSWCVAFWATDTPGQAATTSPARLAPTTADDLPSVARAAPRCAEKRSA